MLILFMVVFLFGVRSDVYGAEYVVTAGGTTFGQAQSLAKAGDVLVIRGKIGAINITKPGLTIRGGVVDGGNLTGNNASAVLISADNTTLEDMEIVNGWSTGFRTLGGTKNLVARRLNVHHNVRENFSKTGGCLTTTEHGWGAAMRAFKADGVAFSDSYVW